MLSIEERGPRAFLDIEVKPTKIKLGLPMKEIKAWQKAREQKAKRVVGKATIKIPIGWPKEDEPRDVPVLAAAEFEDRWEVLALYGSTHYFSKGEIASVEERDAA